MFGIAGREASDEFLRMTEHPSSPSAQLSGDVKYRISRMSNNSERDVQEVANRNVKSIRCANLDGTCWRQWCRLGKIRVLFVS